MSWLLPASPLLASVLTGTALVIVVAVVLEVLSRFIRAFVRRAGARPVTLRAIRDTLRVTWIVFGIAVGLTVATQTGISSQLTILTISGIAGLVLSLSLQTLFSNMIAGVLLLQDSAIRVGDIIEFSGVKGRVARVALRNTWVVTEAGTVAIIGNNALLGGPLINYTASGRHARELGLTPR